MVSPSRLPIVALSIGDPAGIGPELCMKAGLSEQVTNSCRPLLFGDPRVMKAHADSCGLEILFDGYRSVEEVDWSRPGVKLIELDLFSDREFHIAAISGDNGKAAFITRGLVEITRLGVAAGAHPMTFAGLAGLGDLIATCGSPLSRNRYVGEQLAYGRHLDQVLSSMESVAEGVDTTAAAMLLAANLGVDMPLINAIHRVLFDGLDPRKVVGELMTRAPSTEWRGIKGLQ